MCTRRARARLAGGPDADLQSRNLSTLPLLGHIEAPAVDGGAGDRERHELALGFYHKIKRMKTTAPFTVTELTREIRP